MSAELQERYDNLRDDFDRLAGAIAGIRHVTLTQDPDNAAAMLAICETFACGVLDQHPRGKRRGDVEA